MSAGRHEDDWYFVAIAEILRLTGMELDSTMAATRTEARGQRLVAHSAVAIVKIRFRECAHRCDTRDRRAFRKAVFSCVVSADPTWSIAIDYCVAAEMIPPSLRS